MNLHISEFESMKTGFVFALKFETDFHFEFGYEAETKHNVSTILYAANFEGNHVFSLW